MSWRLIQVVLEDSEVNYEARGRSNVR